MERRYPQELSGGQQQRVALARMLVVSPSIFLMDEPLSNLDAKLRMEMRTEIKRIHRESKATTVYVTHDQTEALTLSSKVAVMDKGVLQQVDSPQSIYRRPANLFVADFIGSPTINLIPGKIISKNDEVLFDGETFSFIVPFMKDFCGEPVIAAIRPEEIQVSHIEDKGAISGEVYSVLPAGAEVILQVKRTKTVLNIRLMGEPSFEVGEKIYLQLPVDSIIFYHQKNGTLLHPQ